ncbi:MAG: sodium-coupled transporter, partial [Anaerolineales bacterium]|nr:sodium-coupled transporter [Anaerolineales bacterium]
SKLLIPLAWASLMGGNLTLIGTPPNILASSILQTYPNIENFTFFDFAPMGLIMLATGILYMVLVGRHLLPDRTAGGELSDDYPIREYLSEVQVLENSALIGKTVRQSGLGEKYDLNIIHIQTAADETLSSDSHHRLQAGDRLLIEGAASTILSAGQNLGLASLSAGEGDDPPRVPDGSLKLAELVLSPKSGLHGKTLLELDFRTRYGLGVMAIRHDGATLLNRLGDVRLRFGDSLLVEGPPERLALLRRDPDFLLLDTDPPLEPRRLHKAPLTVAILLFGLTAVTTGLLPVPVALLIGAILMVLSGALSMEEAYQAIEWKSVFLIAGMLPLGIAMEKTGTAQLLADWLVDGIGGWGALAVLMGIYLLTSLLTEVMSNAAATVLVTPIAIDAALQLGADPRAFVIGIVLAASTSFLMPIGHQVNVIVFGPGGYRFSDYTRVGIFLNIIFYLVVLLTLPLVWPLFP